MKTTTKLLYTAITILLMIASYQIIKTTNKVDKLVHSSRHSAHFFCPTLSVASFNIEWFGHGNHKRTQKDIQQLANYIKSLEIDVLACQEIHPTGDTTGNNIPDWDDLMTELGEHYI